MLLFGKTMEDKRKHLDFEIVSEKKNHEMSQKSILQA